MVSPTVTATVQSSVLGATSNILAQAIRAYRQQRPFDLQLIPIIRFIIYNVLNCPPNFHWQLFLEDTFPGHRRVNSKGKTVSGKSRDIPAGVSKLNMRNTAIKFVLDQSLGAAVNTVMFIAMMAGLQGATGQDIIAAVQRDFWSIMMAGMKLWPAVSLFLFTSVPAERRVLIASLVNVGWGIYLSLLASG